VTARFPAPGGGGGTVGFFHFVQGAPSAFWTVVHSLGFRPDVQVFDSSGDQVEGDVDHVSVDELTITFSAAFSGVAELN
jgi:hypothetical protein